MCGICGISVGPNEHADVSAVATTMLLGIENRGQDATGAAWWSRSDLYVDKAAIPASAFIDDLDVPADATAFIGHTRWATQGSPKTNDNNHPIDVGRLVGIHNGVLANDDALFDQIGPEHRIAQVDSEAIFAWLQRSDLPVGEALTYLRGSAAIAWLDAEEQDTLHLARVAHSPLIVAATHGGSLLFASTRSCVQTAADHADLSVSVITSIDEGTHLTIQRGEIVDVETFTTDERRSLTDIERRALSV